MAIHSLALVHPSAQLGANVTIEPFAIIDADVVIGDNCWIGASAAIKDGTRMGNGCRVFNGAIVGSVPQDLKFGGEKTQVVIGDNVTIREYCTINRGTEQHWKTEIGDDTLIMAYAHIAHDCIIGRNCVIVNSVNLAGHVEIDDWAILGGGAMVHQFVKVGKHAMVSGGSLLRTHVPPYVKAGREPVQYEGVNVLGLERRGFNKETIEHIKQIYRILFVDYTSRNKGIEAIKEEIPDSPYRQEILNFLEVRDESRGLIKGYSAGRRESDEGDD